MEVIRLKLCRSAETALCHIDGGITDAPLYASLHPCLHGNEDADDKRQENGIFRRVLAANALS